MLPSRFGPFLLQAAFNRFHHSILVQGVGTVSVQGPLTALLNALLLMAGQLQIHNELKILLILAEVLHVIC